ncbi:MarR family winged helix-turn-helix transcriptional regulator [Agromyces sp. H3Y2-19a]|jgi:DNA-binding MarR family transcriptional regulator|uniref:MarR family winged helix-turn-helix transcriptional regulator n=1 Tax=Agromyces TaxID=33877 RepID=UPI001E31C39C|nr:MULTISPECIES: MarR family winged helix-turn-helix transcriptional regulator [Agromyces]MCD5346057.1 MarR family winged helix-turn-helix transcriptional regulator [Agromyces sp. S2-1-8]MDF0512420.1 MarR family winged helix-turn-helix transcriptional regulator [Agromyces chromiiresistens]
MVKRTPRDEHAAAILRELIVITRRGVADARTAQFSLSMTDQSILGYIVDHPQCRSTDIAEAFRLNRSTVSRQLAGLTRLGVVREIADASGRGRPLELTDAGWSAYREAIALLQGVVDRHLGDWNDAEVARFATDLTRFNDAATDGDRPRHPRDERAG